MIFNTSNQYEIQPMKDYLKKLVASGAVVEIKKKSPIRSQAQNRYLHVILGFFGAEYGMSMEEVKVDLYKRTCNREIFERKAVNKHGKEITYLRSTSDLSSAEMSLSVDRFRNWSSAVAGIYLPAPNEEAFLAYCEQEIERNKEFI